MSSRTVELLSDRAAQIALIARHIDAEFYRRANPDVDFSRTDPATHYCEAGWREGRDPAPDFSTTGYLQRYPDIREAGINPFLHWLQAGRAEGRCCSPPGAEAAGPAAMASWVPEAPGAPDAEGVSVRFASAGQRREFLRDLEGSGLFDPVWYAARHPQARAARSPFAHYAAHGLEALHDPCALFSCRFYLQRNPDIAAAGMHPLFHYLYWGGAEGRQPHPWVVPAWLAGRLDAAALAAAPHANPLIAYARLPADAPPLPPRPLFDLSHLSAQPGLAGRTGWEILRAYALRDPADRPDPCPLFRGDFVAETHPEAAGDPLAAYLEAAGAGINPHPLFDNDRVFAQQRLDWPGRLGLTLLEVFLDTPAPPDLSPHPLFDARHYLAEAGGALPPGCHPLVHYLSGGWRAGFRPNPWFDGAAYAARYMADADPGQSPLEHYLIHGREPWVDLSPDFAQALYLARHPGLLRDYPHTPLQHFVEHGRYEGARPTGIPPWQDDFASWSELRAAVAAGFADPPPEAPEVSVIVPVYNQFAYTLRCLYSILRAGDAAEIEVILADDGSDDDTEAVFSAIPGIRYRRNAENLGFLKSCNAAAATARGRYLYFLNNDTAVLPGWVDRLLASFAAHPEAGLIGAKLIYPEGTLQEAGGHVWRNGGGANAGRGGDPDEPGFNYLRDVDYVSGAAIMVPRALWRRLGGFDTRYAPAYCEDSDLAMRIRQHGYRVLYQPRAQVVHFEGVSSGRSLSGGVKAYQTRNQARQREIWEFALERHAEDHRLDPRALPRPARPRILVIDAITPTPDRDSGSLSAWWFLRIFTGLGYDVTFIPANLALGGTYGHALQEMGVELLHGPYIRDIGAYLRDHAHEFDLFFLYRVVAGGAWAQMLRGLCPQTPLIFDTVDLHYLRAEREARLEGAGPKAAEEARALKARELGLIRMATDTIVVSTAERELLREEEGVQAPLTVIALVIEPRETPARREGRSGIAFVGGYRHTPNIDAVLAFLSDVWPELRAAMPDLEFHIAGSHPPEEITSIREDGVVVHGFVPDLDAFLDQRIASVAPLRYGAGVKGKVGSSLAAGLPCIASPIAAEGMGLEEGKEILIAREPQDWVDAVRRLHEDEALWQLLSDAGRAFVAREYAPEAARKLLLRLLAKTDTAPFSGRCPITGRAERRRFLDLADPDSLAPAPEGPRSGERVLAHALARALGAPGCALAHLPDAARAAGPVMLAGDLPRLAEACARAGLTGPGAPRILLAALRLDAGAGARLFAALEEAPEARRLAVACLAHGAAVGDPPEAPEAVAALVEALVAAGWEMRCDRMALPECGLTRVILLEGRRA